MDPRPDGSRRCFGPHHAIRRCWPAFKSHGGMVGSHPVSISHRLAPAEGARSGGGAADGSGLARLGRACCAAGPEDGFCLPGWPRRIRLLPPPLPRSLSRTWKNIDLRPVLRDHRDLIGAVSRCIRQPRRPSKLPQSRFSALLGAKSLFRNTLI